MHTVTSFPHDVRVIENTFVTMPDGCKLSARIWLPEGAENNTVPAVLEYIPYRHRDATRARDELNHPYIAGHGYACVRVDLRGSGSLEQDGDVIILLHREDYYRYSEPVYLPNHRLEAIVAKNKKGCVGTVPLHFSGKTQRVTDWRPI